MQTQASVRMISRFFMLLVVGVLSACAVMQQLVKAPSVSVTGMQLEKTGLFEQVLQFDLELDNPNAFALPLAAMNYTLEISGVEIGKGSQTKALNLPAYGQAKWPVSFKVNSLRLLQSALEKGDFSQLEYRVFGNFQLSDSAQIPSIPFDKSGRVGS